MTPADLDAVSRIQAAGAPHSAAGWEARSFLAQESFVAVLDGAVAGYLVSRRPAPGIDEFELLDLAVDGSKRRTGVGRGLMGYVLGIHSGTWYLEVRVSNTGARCLYESLGFRTTRIRRNYYNHPVEDGLEMTKHS